jgi:hypothetical protein
MARAPITKRFASSAIASMRWEPDDDRETEGTLTVVFVSGQTYQLDGVGVQEAQDLAHATSPGTYWNTYLKGNY